MPWWSRKATCSSPAEEWLQYVHSLDLDLAPSEVRLLEERTEGWAIGLQMVGLALRGRTRDETEHFIRVFVGSVHLGDATSGKKSLSVNQRMSARSSCRPPSWIGSIPFYATP